MKNSSHTLPSGTDRYSDQVILFCGHAGTFIGDIIITPFAVTIISKKQKEVSGGTLRRTGLNKSEWHISDENGGYWGWQSGTFVLPRVAVTRLSNSNRHQFVSA